MPHEALVEAKRALAVPPDANLWLFGAWNAGYTAAHDYVNEPPDSTALIDTDQATYSRCTAVGSQVRALDPIATGWFTCDGLSDRLTEIHSVAYESTLADTRFSKMRAQVDECIVEPSDYEVVAVGDELGGVAVSDD